MCGSAELPGTYMVKVADIHTAALLALKPRSDYTNYSETLITMWIFPCTFVIGWAFNEGFQEMLKGETGLFANFYTIFLFVFT